MHNDKNQHQVRDNTLSRDIIAYVANKKNNIRIKNIQTATKKPVNTVSLYQNNNRNSNINFVNIKNNKSFEFQVLFGELESLLLNMNRNDAIVQRALIKLNEIRTRIFPELKKAEEYDQVIKS